MKQDTEENKMFSTIRSNEEVNRRFRNFFSSVSDIKISNRAYNESRDIVEELAIASNRVKS